MPRKHQSNKHKKHQSSSNQQQQKMKSLFQPPEPLVVLDIDDHSGYNLKQSGDPKTTTTLSWSPSGEFLASACAITHDICLFRFKKSVDSSYCSQKSVRKQKQKRKEEEDEDEDNNNNNEENDENFELDEENIKNGDLLGGDCLTECGYQRGYQRLLNQSKSFINKLNPFDEQNPQILLSWSKHQQKDKAIADKFLASSVSYRPGEILIWDVEYIYDVISSSYYAMDDIGANVSVRDPVIKNQQTVSMEWHPVEKNVLCSLTAPEGAVRFWEICSASGNFIARGHTPGFPAPKYPRYTFEHIDSAKFDVSFTSSSSSSSSAAAASSSRNSSRTTFSRSVVFLFHPYVSKTAEVMLLVSGSNSKQVNLYRVGLKRRNAISNNENEKEEEMSDMEDETATRSIFDNTENNPIQTSTLLHGQIIARYAADDTIRSASFSPFHRNQQQENNSVFAKEVGTVEGLLAMSSASGFINLYDMSQVFHFLDNSTQYTTTTKLFLQEKPREKNFPAKRISGKEPEGWFCRFSSCSTNTNTLYCVGGLPLSCTESAMNESEMMLLLGNRESESFDENEHENGADENKNESQQQSQQQQQQQQLHYNVSSWRVGLWNFPLEFPKLRLKHPRDPIFAIDVSPGGKVIATACCGSKIFLWKAPIASKRGSQTMKLFWIRELSADEKLRQMMESFAVIFLTGRFLE